MYFLKVKRLLPNDQFVLQTACVYSALDQASANALLTYKPSTAADNFLLPHLLLKLRVDTLL